MQLFIVIAQVDEKDYLGKFVSGTKLQPLIGFEKKVTDGFARHSAYSLAFNKYAIV